MNLDSEQSDFYDRFLRALGGRAMENLQKSDVIVLGLSGLGQEIAKNVILSGVKKVYLCDDENVEFNDLASSFYFKEEHVGKNRAECCLGLLQERNEFVAVEIVKFEKITEEFLNKITCVCCTDKPIPSLEKFSDLCRSTETKMVFCESLGLFGSIFCDFLQHEVFDPNGEKRVENNVDEIKNTNPVLVTVLEEGFNHGLGWGDSVVFTKVEGMEEINHEKDKKPYEIDINGEGIDGRHTFILKGVDGTKLNKHVKNTGFCYQVIPENTFDFLPLCEAIEKPEILGIGEWDYEKKFLHPLSRGCNDFLIEEKRYPLPYNEEDAKKLLNFVKKYEFEIDEKEKEDFEKRREEIVKIFSYTCRGNINPMAAFLGGVASQEVVNACSKKYTPLKQWLYIDFFDIFTKAKFLEQPTPEDAAPKNCRYDGNIQVFGSKFQKRINNRKIFMIGAGALGCEYLKNFALMGIGTKSEEGEVVVTDMDAVENSNRSRQMLFNKDSIGKMKSIAACETAKSLINSDFNCVGKTAKVCKETESVFDIKFWEDLDFCVNAVDNIHARLYVDSKCVLHLKPLVEAGTEGPKANTLIVIPNQTENYGATSDMQTKTIPMCTVKSFPYKIEHCVKWGKDSFVEFFTDIPKLANIYLENEKYVDDLMKKDIPLVQKLATLERLFAILVKDRPKTFEDCIEWARLRLEEFFVNNIVQMSYTIPEDAKIKGQAFWSGDKRFPKRINFDFNDMSMREFVTAGALLRAEVFGIKFDKKENFDWKTAIDKIDVPKFIPSDKLKMKDFMDLKDDEKKEEEIEGEGEAEKMKIISVDEEDRLNKLRVEEIIKSLPERKNMTPLEVINFEKDDDKNHHIEFITGASNNRATNYKIEHADKYKTKGIAGDIIPAMITTTSMICGLGSFEMLKIIAGKEEGYKNAYCSLGICYISLSDPREVAKHKYLGKEFTIYDKIVVNVGKDMTLKEFLKHMEEVEKLEVLMINFNVSKDKTACAYGNLDVDENRKVSQILMDVGYTPPVKGDDYMYFEIIADDVAEVEEIENLPLVKYKFRNFENKE